MASEITIEPLTKEEHLYELSRMYAVDEPISVALGVTPEDWVSLTKKLLSGCVGNGTSFVALSPSGELVGGIVCHRTVRNEADSDAPAIPDGLCPGHVAIFTAMAELEETQRSEELPENAFTLMMGCTRSDHRGRGLQARLLSALFSSIPRGSLVATGTSNEYSYLACARRGCVIKAELDYGKWMLDGKRPFEDIPSPHRKARLVHMFADK